jgi:hypothetical protein
MMRSRNEASANTHGAQAVIFIFFASATDTLGRKKEDNAYSTFPHALDWALQGTAEGSMQTWSCTGHTGGTAAGPAMPIPTWLGHGHACAVQHVSME